jgi:hypothetical protein
MFKAARTSVTKRPNIEDNLKSSDGLKLNVAFRWRIAKQLIWGEAFRWEVTKNKLGVHP